MEFFKIVLNNQGKIKYNFSVKPKKYVTLCFIKSEKKLLMIYFFLCRYIIIFQSCFPPMYPLIN